MPVPTATAAAGVASFIIQSLIFSKAVLSFFTICGCDAQKQIVVSVNIKIVHRKNILIYNWV